MSKHARAKPSPMFAATLFFSTLAARNRAIDGDDYENEDAEDCPGIAHVGFPLAFKPLRLDVAGIR